MTTAPVVLALDVSKTCTGVAAGRVGEAPRFFSIRGVPGEDTGRAILRLGRWLIDWTKAEPPDVIYFEAPINPGAFIGEYNPDKGKVEMTSNPNTTISLAKMVAVVEFVAGMSSIPLRSAYVASIRKDFLGSGRIPGEEAKRRAAALCRIIGWSPNNNDEADAGALWWFAGTKVAPKLAFPVTAFEQARAANAVAVLGQERIDRTEARKLFAKR